MGVALFARSGFGDGFVDLDVCAGFLRVDAAVVVFLAGPQQTWFHGAAGEGSAGGGADLAADGVVGGFVVVVGGGWWWGVESAEDFLTAAAKPVRNLIQINK